MQQESQRRIVVTGVGVVSPLAVEVDTFWSRLTAGESGVHHLKTVDTSAYKVRFRVNLSNKDYIIYSIFVPYSPYLCKMG